MDKMPKEQVLEYKLAFSQYDRDGNGKISQKELGEAMRSAGEKPSEAQLKQLLKEFDFDGNGTIDFQEYVALVERFWSWK